MIKYKRVLLKLSGEALMGDADFGIQAETLDYVADQVSQLSAKNIELGIVVGGGNIFRGVSLASKGVDRVAGDHMGMLATVMNGIALKNAFDAKNIATKLYSNLPVPSICDNFTARDARKMMKESFVTIFAGGSGNPFFTTDTAAALKAAELGCDVLLKATQVDGVYDCDPKKNHSAKRFDTISFDEVIARNLQVMDVAAFSLARDHHIPVIVANLRAKGGILAILEGQVPFTVIDGG